MRIIKNFFLIFILIVPLGFVSPVSIHGIQGTNSTQKQRAALQQYLDSGEDVDAAFRKIVTGNDESYEDSDETSDLIRFHNVDGSVYTSEEPGWGGNQASIAPRSAAEASANTFPTVLISGTGETGVNIAIAGDGYQASQQSTFVALATQVANHFTSFYPFNMFKDFINVYAIQVESVDSGISDNSAVPVINKNTFFNSRWVINSNNAWGLSMNYSTMTTIRNANIPEGSVSGVVLANSTRPAATASYSNGSASGTNCVVGTASVSRAGNTTIHEVGHALASLGDEYNILSGQNERVNRTHENNATEAAVKWRAFLGVESPSSSTSYNNTVQILRFIQDTTHHSYRWFRPTASCNMNQSSGQPFCMVCNVEIFRVMANKTNISNHYFAAPAWDSTQNRSIPNGAFRVLDYAFAGNSDLVTVTLPSSINTVGYMAFLNTTNLMRINIKSATPPTFPGRNGINGAFIGVGSTPVNRGNIDLYIPAGTRTKYQSAWPGFKSYTEEGAPVVVTGVTVSPGTARISRGGTQDFSAIVQGSGGPSQSVKWSVSGNAVMSAGTTISDNGKLTVATSEASTTLTVRATSVDDTSVSGAANVTIRANAGNAGHSASIIYDGTTFNLDTITGLFTIPGDGERTYQIVSGGTGTASVSGRILTVTRAGTIIIGLTTSQTDNYAAGTRVDAILTVNRASVFNTAINQSIPFTATVDLASSGLFNINSNAGSRTYTIESDGTGQGTIEGTTLAITTVGTFYIGLVTAQTDLYAAGDLVTAVLTVAAAKMNPTAPTITAIITYSPTLTLANVALPNGWVWENQWQNLVAGPNSYKAIHLETLEYSFAESMVAFTVQKANPIAPTISKIILTDGMTLADIQLPDGWQWEDGSILLGLGAQSFNVIFEGDNNYNAVTIAVNFTVANPTGNGLHPLAAVGIGVLAFLIATAIFISILGQGKSKKESLTAALKTNKTKPDTKDTK